MKPFNPIKSLKLVALSTVTLTLVGADVAHAQNTVNFEDAETLNLQDNIAILDQYLETGFSFGIDNNLDGIADSGLAPTLELAGGSDSGNAFAAAGVPRDSAKAGFYDEANGITNADRLGNYFLKVGGQGNLLITYAEGTSAASGEIWDIDGTSANHNEQWEIQALDENGQILESITSISGKEAQGAYDGKAWHWSFERDTADVKAVRTVFTGQGGGYVGYDNFSTGSAGGPARPVPYEMESSVGLLLIGGFVGYRKLKSKQHQAKSPLVLD